MSPILRGTDWLTGLHLIQCKVGASWSKGIFLPLIPCCVPYEATWICAIEFADPNPSSPYKVNWAGSGGYEFGLHCFDQSLSQIYLLVDPSVSKNALSHVCSILLSPSPTPGHSGLFQPEQPYPIWVWISHRQAGVHPCAQPVLLWHICCTPGPVREICTCQRPI